MILIRISKNMRLRDISRRRHHRNFASRLTFKPDRRAHLDRNGALSNMLLRVLTATRVHIIGNSIRQRVNRHVGINRPFGSMFRMLARHKIVLITLHCFCLLFNLILHINNRPILQAFILQILRPYDMTAHFHHQVITYAATTRRLVKGRVINIVTGREFIVESLLIFYFTPTSPNNNFNFLRNLMTTAINKRTRRHTGLNFNSIISSVYTPIRHGSILNRHSRFRRFLSCRFLQRQMNNPSRQ